MASSGGNWHSKKSGGRVFVGAGETKAKASARGDKRSEREFTKIVGGGLRKREGELIRKDGHRALRKKKR